MPLQVADPDHGLGDGGGAGGLDQKGDLLFVEFQRGRIGEKATIESQEFFADGDGFTAGVHGPPQFFDYRGEVLRGAFQGFQ